MGIQVLPNSITTSSETLIAALVKPTITIIVGLLFPTLEELEKWSHEPKKMIKD